MGRLARRIYATLALALLFFTASLHVRSYLMVRRIEAVLKGFSEIRVDQTTESELHGKVPYLVRPERDWTTDGAVERFYHVDISNESDHIIPRIIYSLPPWGERAAAWLGYRPIAFNAFATIHDGRVQKIGYGVSKLWIQPRFGGCIVSARSVHSLWMERQRGFHVRSQDDFSPQFRIEEFKDGDRETCLSVTFTNDAPFEQTQQAFQVKLDCIWSLSPCTDARAMAPQLWSTKQAIDSATYNQLISERCPESIIRGRMQYLPDVSVLLLEVTGSRRVEVNEEGETVEDWFTDYRLKEVIRGRTEEQSWNNVRFRRLIPSVRGPWSTMANQIWPSTQVGTEVLFFGNHRFDSCRFVPATHSALEIVRDTPTPPKRAEDQIVRGLL